MTYKSTEALQHFQRHWHTVQGSWGVGWIKGHNGQKYRQYCYERRTSRTSRKQDSKFIIKREFSHKYLKKILCKHRNKLTSIKKKKWFSLLAVRYVQKDQQKLGSFHVLEKCQALCNHRCCSSGKQLLFSPKSIHLRFLRQNCYETKPDQRPW